MDNSPLIVLQGVCVWGGGGGGGWGWGAIVRSSQTSLVFSLFQPQDIQKVVLKSMINSLLKDKK